MTRSLLAFRLACGLAALGAHPLPASAAVISGTVIGGQAVSRRRADPLV